MALSANLEVVEQEGKLLSMAKDSAAIFRGAIVGVKANGLAAPSAPQAGSHFAGIAHEEKAAGDSEVRVVTQGCFVLKGSGFAQTNVGDTVYASDDETVTLTAGTDGKQVVGKIVKYLSSTQVLVQITPMQGTGPTA